MPKQAMTAGQAVSFERVSIPNAMLLALQLKCQCQPYKDVFTFNRWKAQGFYVRRGEHGYHLPLVKTIEVVEEGGDGDAPAALEKRILGSSVVFCRCQVEKKEVR